MNVFNLVSSLRRILSAQSTGVQRRRSRYLASPRLEHLEDRFAPAITNLNTHATYASIQAAVTAANPGDTILADAGTYAEQVSINKSLILEGAQHGVDARDGRPGAQESILSIGFGGLTLNADNITIDGFTVTNASSSNANGLIAGGSTSNNLVLKNTILTDDNAPTGAPILFQGGSHTNMQFSQDLFQDKGDSTFYFGSSAAGDLYDGLNISNSKFLGQAGGVFYADSTGGNPLKNAVIQGNEFDGTVNGTPGVGDPILNIGQSVNLTISGNYFHDENYTAFQVGMIGGSITGNTFARIHANAGVGFGDDFQLWGGQYGTAVSTNVTIANNLINYNDVAGATLPTRGIRLRPQDASSSAPGIDGTTIHIHDNAFVNGGVLSSGTFALIDQGDPTKPIDASGNWWDTTLGADPTASTPFLAEISALMSGPVHVGSFLNSGPTAAVGFTPAASTEMWVPQTAATTGNAVVDGNIQDGVDTAVPGMTVRVAADDYPENVVVNKSLTLVGANDTNPVPGRIGPETVVEPGLNSSFNTSSIFTVEANNVTIEGFTIQGSIASLPAGQSAGFKLTSGTTAYAAAGVSNSTNVATGGLSPSTIDVSGLTVQNNIIRDFTQVGVYGDTADATPSTGNIIADNVITDIPNNSQGGYYGEGVIIYDNFYADVTGNKLTAVRTGIQTGNNNVSVGSFVPSISDNSVSAYVKGIYYNLQYQSASPFTISNNNITQADGSVSPAYNVGLLVQSIQDSVQSVIQGNNVSGFLYGVEFAGDNTTNTVTLRGGTLSDNGYGVWDTNNDYFYPANYNSSAALDGVTIVNSTNAGVWVDTTSPSKNGPANTTNSASLAIGGGTTITGGPVGLLVAGTKSLITGDTLNNTTFAGQTGQYIDLTQGALAGSTLDATGVAFDSHTGATATLAQNFAIEDKVFHATDEAGLGFVRVKAGNVFVTPASGSVQRGVNAASTGDTVNVAAGTYSESVSVNKTVTLLGAQHGVDARTGRPGAMESIVDNSGGPFYVTANSVSIDGFTVQGETNQAFTGYGILLGAGTSGSHVLNNIIQDNIAGLALANNSTTSQTVIQYNLFRNNDQPGPARGTDIYADQFTAGAGGVDNVLIDSNTFINKSFVESAYALGMSNTGTTPFSNITFSNNNVTNHGRGAYFFGTTSSFVTGNTITGASHYAIGLFGNNGSAANSSFTISNNTLDAKGSGGAGVELANDTSAPAYTGTLTVSNFGLLVTDVKQEVVNVRPGAIDYGITEVDYSKVSQVNLNNTTAVNATPGPNTGDRATAFSGLTANERVVQAAYLDNLGRAGSKAELDGWLPVLTGPGGQQAVAGAIEGSLEARDRLVKTWYQTYLGRSANGTEELGWVNLLGSGQSEEQVLSQILGSTEFYNHAQKLVSNGTSDQRYVEALYQVLLSRTASDTEVAAWVNDQSQVGRPAAALSFLGSQEFRTDQFEAYYNALLRRPDDPTGLNSWVMSNLDLHTARVGFESSPEFFTNG